MRRRSTIPAFFAASAALLGQAMPRLPEPKVKEPLAASPQDERNLRQMRDALKLYDCEGADAWSIAAMLRRHEVRHPGTAGSWMKRLRRLALLGWAKRKRNGTWELTAAGRKAAAS